MNEVRNLNAETSFLEHKARREGGTRRTSKLLIQSITEAKKKAKEAKGK